MKIVDVVCEPVRSGFYRDDQAAIRAGAAHDGFLYVGWAIRLLPDSGRARSLAGLD
jgi:methylaspartate ammonia-lyase